MSITHLSSLSQHDALLSAKSSSLVVIDFHASWCGPCHAIAPKFEQLSQQYRHVTFAKVDVDAAKEIAAKYSVRAMPTFIFLKQGQKVGEVKGADPKALESAIKQHGGSASSSSTASFSGAGRTLGGTIAPASSQPSSLPDLKVMLGLAALLALWMWYGSKVENGGAGVQAPTEHGGWM